MGPGDKVRSGSVSQGGHLEVVAERVGADTTFQRLIFLVVEAQEQKPRVQRLLDRFARWYTPSVMMAPWRCSAFSPETPIWPSTFLVIACPGALVVACRWAIIAGLGRAARSGILIKGGEQLERIGRADAVAMDKTGTLTYGKPMVTAVIPFDGFDATTVLALAAAAEQRSEHHLATAYNYAREQGVTAVPASDGVSNPASGAVVCTYSGLVLVGNEKLLEAHGIHLTSAQAEVVAERQLRGESVALVAVDGRAAGVIGISDRVRRGCPAAGARTPPGRHPAYGDAHGR